jgi:hypothetical protein
MQITKEFLETEIQSQATIQAYKMLINRLEAPEPEQKDGN